MTCLEPNNSKYATISYTGGANDFSLRDFAKRKKEIRTTTTGRQHIWPELILEVSPAPTLHASHEASYQADDRLHYQHFDGVAENYHIPFCCLLVALGTLIVGSSLAVGLYYSIARDRMGDGFTATGWMTGVGTLVLAAPMAKHYLNCRY